jgi:hypothetical protein
METSDQVIEVEEAEFTLRRLYRVGGAAALGAALFGCIQIIIEVIGVGFMHIEIPNTVTGWFTLLQNHTLLGLTALTLFQIPTFILCVPVFLALYFALKRAHWVSMLIATAFALLGITVYIASNTVIPMYLLSGQYAAASTDLQRSAILAAGQAMFAIYEGSGVDVGLFLFMLALFMISLIMRKSSVFNPITAYIGFLAGLVALIYYLSSAFSPSAIFIYEFAGLLFLVWSVLIGRGLWQLGDS